MKKILIAYAVGGVGALSLGTKYLEGDTELKTLFTDLRIFSADGHPS
jgi:hypothetical protein